jgi:exodeoxyribonuclease VII large subunit
LFGSAVRLRQASPGAMIRNNMIRLGNLKKNVVISYGHDLDVLKKRLEADMFMLDTLSPLSVLRRGYSITKTMPAGIVVKNADMVALGGGVDITLAAGGFLATVTEIFGGVLDGKGKI